MRYLDTANREYSHSLHAWLAEHLASASFFACQSGYFRAAALRWFEEEILGILQRGGEVHLVVGANEDRLVAGDLYETVRLLEPWLGDAATFTVVTARDVLFHPKTYYSESADGTRAAVITSANFTPNGLGGNVEAGLAFDDSDNIDASVFDQIRDAIVEWTRTPSEQAIPINPESIRELEAERVIEPSGMALGRRRAREGPSIRKNRPALDRIPGVPPLPRAAPAPSQSPAVQQIEDAEPLPTASAGIVKILSDQDLKGIRGERGTAYIALPRALAPHLPMRPAGRNQEPRIDVAVEARIDSALGDTVLSGTSTTNITHVGVGERRTGHADLRFNVLTAVSRGLVQLAARQDVSAPAGGDLLAIEFLDDGRFVRLTFATQDPLRAALRSLCTELDDADNPTSGWGWLPAGVVPPW
jgi:hypothetical protein